MPPKSSVPAASRKKAVKRARDDDHEASQKAASAKGKVKAASSKAKATKPSSSSKKAKPAAGAAAKKARVAAAAPALSPLDPSNKPSLRLQLSQLTIPELKANLESNEQSHFGLNKVELIKKIQQCNQKGCIKRCTQCKFGHLKPRKKGQPGSKFVCPGCQSNKTETRRSNGGMPNYREGTSGPWNACGATAEELKRWPFKLPAGVKDYTGKAFVG